jgi:3',5'-cyclic AMP phosphodiesterase CpdA
MLKYRNFLLVFIVFSALIFNNVRAESIKPLKFAFVPDLHLSFEHKNDWIMKNESMVIFQEVLSFLNSMQNLDFVVFGGDIINNDDGKFSDLAFFIDSTSELKHRYYTIFGDREADLKEGFDKIDFTSEFRKNGFLDKNRPYWAAVYDDKLLIGLDTSILNGFGGEIPPEQMEWLKNILENNKNRFTIIFMHHPAVINRKKLHPNKEFLLSNSAEFLKLVKNNPQVKLVLSGHHHIKSVAKINGTLFVTSPSVVTYPNYFEVLTIFPDRVEFRDQKIPYRQLVKKGKKSLVNSDYAKQYDNKKPSDIFAFQEGSKEDKSKVYKFD